MDNYNIILHKLHLEPKYRQIYQYQLITNTIELSLLPIHLMYCIVARFWTTELEQCLFPCHTLDKRFHAVGAGLLHLVGHMTVDIQRESDGGMTEVSLHRLDIVTGSERSYCIRVAQIMKAGVRPANGCRGTFECSVQRRLRQVLSLCICKDKVATRR